jgi:hypothetical protein
MGRRGGRSNLGLSGPAADQGDDVGAAAHLELLQDAVHRVLAAQDLLKALPVEADLGQDEQSDRHRCPG